MELHHNLDTIKLSGLKVHGKHGVFADEKANGHDFLIDACLYADLSQAGISDALEATINYGEVADLIFEVVNGPSVDLIENLAQQILDSIFETYPLVRQAEITINKPTAPIPHPFQNVSVKLCRIAPLAQALVSMGSNEGDSLEYFEFALKQIQEIPGTKVRMTSSIYETKPVSDIEQRNYLNAALFLETELSPWQLLRELQKIELAGKRTREVRWGPRTLDLDLISWAGIRLNSDFLTLPHPRAHERAFVMQPLLEIEVNRKSQGIGKELRLSQDLSVDDAFAEMMKQEQTAANDLSGIKQVVSVAGFGAVDR